MCKESIIDGRRGDLGRFPWEYCALATKDQPEIVGAFTDLFLYRLGVHRNLSYLILEEKYIYTSNCYQESWKNNQRKKDVR